MTSIENGACKTSSSQQYNLKWTNHTSNILQMFAEQFSKESYTDITLACEGKFIKAHKMVLSACSPYFEEIFNTYLVPHPMIVMNGMQFHLLKILVEFMYQGEVKVSDEDLSNLLGLAEQLQVKGLCNVRNKDAKEAKPSEQEIEEENETPALQTRKRRRTSHNSSDSVNSTNVEEKERQSKEFRKEQESATNVSNGENTKSENCSNVNTQPKNGKSAHQSSKQENAAKALPQDLLHDSFKIRRPPNAFMIFANEYRKKLATENPGESNKEISVRLGNMWKSLSNPVKATYYTAAKKADEEHKSKYPGYYYSPKEARIRKELKSSVFRKNKSMEALQVVQLVMTENNDDSAQVVFTESGETEDDEVDYVHEIKDEDENVCDSSTTVMKRSVSQ